MGRPGTCPWRVLAFGVHFVQEKDFTLGDAMSESTDTPFPILRFLISLGLIALLALAGRQAFLRLSSLYVAPEKTAAAQPRTAVKVMEVSRQDYTEVLSGYGLARALRLTDVQAEVVSIVFGLAFATVLTLVLVPAVYLILNDVQSFLRWLLDPFWWLLGDRSGGAPKAAATAGE